MSMSSLCFTEEVNTGCYLLDEESDEVVAIFEEIEKEIEIVLRIIIFTSKCWGLR